MENIEPSGEVIISCRAPLEAVSTASFSIERTAIRSPARVGTDAGTIRPLERGDIPRICELFLKAFRTGRPRRIDDLATAIEATYLASPIHGPDIGSIVHLDERRRINGFLGIINIGMRIGDRPIRAGILSAYMADGPDADPAVGVRLGRAVSSRACDLIFADTANRTSLDMSRALRFETLPLQSLEWVKMLKPAGTVAHVLARKFPAVEGWTHGLARAVDGGLPSLGVCEVDRRTVEGTEDRPIPVSEFIAEAPAFLSGYTLRPTWAADELTWILAQAEMRTRNGPLQVREVIDRGGRRIGLYLLHARPGALAFALQVLARAGRSDLVMGNLIARAKAIGAVAVSGAASPDVVRGLLRQRGIVYRPGGTAVFRTKDREVAAAIKAGDFVLGGLAGETWSRIYADDFS